MTIAAIGVLGAGQMGRGIAQAAAQAGYRVLLADIDQAAAERAWARLLEQMDRLAGAGKLPAATVARARQAIVPAAGIPALTEVDLVIEAAPEQLSVKRDLFVELDRVCPSRTILASNTSSLSLTDIAAGTGRPDRVCGMHFMNPVPVMTLVEGIRALQTSDHTFATVRQVAENMGKVFVESQDMPGFVVNRILMPMINEAICALGDGVASAEDIDRAMKLGTNQPMGPLSLADLIGLDTCLAVMLTLHLGFGDSKYRPAHLLKKYVAAGRLGRKAGRGFFDYAAPAPGRGAKPDPDPAQEKTRS